MEPAPPSPTERRLLRAEAARTLLGLHTAQALAEPERWSWEVLDRLPAWCLFDRERRIRLQRVAGALLMGPELRLWIDRDHLLEAGRLLDEPVLDAVLVRADALAALLVASDDSSATATRPPADETVGALEARFMAAGAAVLVATLHESLPLGALADSLGPRAGHLPESTARHVLLEAERLIFDHCPVLSEAA